MKNYPAFSNFNMNTVFDYSKMIKLQASCQTEIVESDKGKNVKTKIKKISRKVK